MNIMDLARVKILALHNNTISWISLQRAIVYKAQDKSIDIAGDIISISGGRNAKTGEVSQISTATIVMITGKAPGRHNKVNPYYNKHALFRRDSGTCAYCNKYFPDSHLTVDHVDPVHNGGKNVWDNVVSSCLPCNHKKNDIIPGDPRFPHMHFKPYTPCRNEFLILTRGKSILPEQFEFLSGMITNKNSRIKSFYKCK